MTQARLRKLECIRGFAALYVVLVHLAQMFLAHSWCRLPFSFGPEAVMVFFVLSGFVIFYSVTVNPLDLRLGNYAVKRIRRIYPIFVCALAISYLGRAIVMRSLFTPDWKALLGNLAMLQDVGLKPGVWISPFYNLPLWSLSYEWWFYILFIIVVKLEAAPHRRQFWAGAISLAGIISYLAIPNQASLFLMYFMTWWCGVELAREFVEGGTITWKRQMVPVGMLASLSMLWLLPLAHAIARHEHLNFEMYPALICRHILAALGFICIALFWCQFRFAGFERLLGGFAIFAPVSYAMYVVHFPILSAVNSFSPGHQVAIKLAAMLALTVGLSWTLEMQLQPIVNQWSGRFLARRHSLKTSSDRPAFGTIASARQ